MAQLPRLRIIYIRIKYQSTDFYLEPYKRVLTLHLHDMHKILSA